MPVVSKIRQYVIDVNHNGQFAGATKVIQRRVVENDVDIGGMENVLEAVPVDELQAILGASAAGHVQALEACEQTLANERATWATEKQTLVDNINSLELQLRAENKTNQDLTAKVNGLVQMVQSWTV